MKCCAYFFLVAFAYLTVHIIRLPRMNDHVYEVFRFILFVVFAYLIMQDAAAAAIFLAAKVEEFRVHINSVLQVTYQVRHGSSRKLDPQSQVRINRHH